MRVDAEAGGDLYKGQALNVPQALRVLLEVGAANAHTPSTLHMLRMVPTLVTCL